MNLLDRIAQKFGITTKHMLRDQLDEQIEFNRSLQIRLHKVTNEKDDAEYLVNMLYGDKEIVEEELERLGRFIDNQGKYVEMFSNLLKYEKKLLCDYVPKRSDIPSEDKIRDRRAHIDPRGYGNFLRKVAECKYINGVYGLRQTRKKFKRTCFNKSYREDGIFIVEGIYVNDNFGKIIKIHTTARNEMEANFIRDLLNSQF